MSMKDWDFGYFGKGLDGYVHFRQGMKEIESHSRPLRKASPAVPPKPYKKSPAKSAPTCGRKKSNWWKYKWEYGFLASTLAFLYFMMRAEALQTAAGASTAWRAGMVFLVFLGIEVIRFVIWVFKSMW